jgi:formylglycine-generating enzyme required for sulfatase activity
MEFLAATWLVNRSLVVPTAMQHMADDWWEPVILLAGAHPSLAENFRSDLVTQVLEKAGDAEDPAVKAHHLVLAGKLAIDMKETLPGPERECVEEHLLDGMRGPQLPARLRAQVGAALGRLGDPRPEATTIEGMAFCLIPPGPFKMGEGEAEKMIGLPAFWLAQFPVTNGQYQAFVNAGGYQAARYWIEAKQAGYWKDGRCKGRYDNESRNRPEQYGDPFRVGNHPVVGVSWYEALAFTRWLNELAHARGWLTGAWQVALPQEAAWEKAARGGVERSLPCVSALIDMPSVLPQSHMFTNQFPDRDYPWEGEFSPEKANTEETVIGATSAVGCFPGGASPYGVQDLSGNVWEWQENWYDHDHTFKELRGGSWDD